MRQCRDDVSEYLFGEGTSYRSYTYFGAHRLKDGTVVFRVWAPHADAVYITGDFNEWSDWKHPLEPNPPTGVWTGILQDETFRNGSRYQFVIEKNGQKVSKADPYAFWSDTHADTASRFLDTEKPYSWNDADFLSERMKLAEALEQDLAPASPINIYEVHLGSWKRHEDNSYLTYTELADRLTPYVKEMGYTHIELLPVMEHPLDGSWGYQVCGYYAPTSRFGNPDGLKYLIDTMHQNGIGVILDWVPAHFPRDSHGLAMFDGTPTFEYENPQKRQSRIWGTNYFDVGRTQVQSFLISNAMYWLDEFHADGLRVDAVASMLYLDYARQSGEWTPNMDGTNINHEAVAFLQKMNRIIRMQHPDCLMIAEESTTFAGVTKQYGLGFNMKWCLGWMNDSLSYLPIDPYFRKSFHNKLTFSMTYALNESHILPVSHDEVVHLKKSLLEKSYGTEEEKFADTRTFLIYMMTHPGKKLLFMGSEFGQHTEWNEDKALDWNVLEEPEHATLLNFVKKLNRFYREQPALWEDEQSWNGFHWALADNSMHNIYAYERFASDGDVLLVCLNFSGRDRERYVVPVRENGWYDPVFETDEIQFGGNGKRAVPAFATSRIGGGYQIQASIPALSAVIYKKRK